jgi:hypothetical protein
VIDLVDNLGYRAGSAQRRFCHSRIQPTGPFKAIAMQSSVDEFFEVFDQFIVFPPRGESRIMMAAGVMQRPPHLSRRKFSS